MQTRAAFRAMWMLCLGLGASAWAHAQALTDPLPALYARYAASGRSDVRIHLSAAGASPSARTQGDADGGYTCRVSGLNRPEGPGPLLVALLIHEVTHCLTGPDLGALRSDSDDPPSRAADRLLALTAEGISDARAVIEVFRRDGSAAAEVLAGLMLAQRRAGSSAAHATAPAITAALALVQEHPKAFGTDAAAFAAALHIGREAALRAASAGVPEPALLAQQAALQRSAQRYAGGRYANTAFTLRTARDGVSADDRHIYVDAAGALRSRPVISAEGAHEVAALQDLLEAPATPEHRLAAQWLRRSGALHVRSLLHARAVLTRFVASLSQAQSASREQVLRLLAETIEASPASADLGSILDATAERQRAPLLAGAPPAN